MSGGWRRCPHGRTLLEGCGLCDSAVIAGERWSEAVQRKIDAQRERRWSARARAWIRRGGPARGRLLLSLAVAYYLGVLANRPQLPLCVAGDLSRFVGGAGLVVLWQLTRRWVHGGRRP